MERIPFDYEKYKEGGYKIVTRDNQFIDGIESNPHPVFIFRAVINDEYISYNQKGKYWPDFEDDDYDLFLVRDEPTRPDLIEEVIVVSLTEIAAWKNCDIEKIRIKL